MVPLMSESLDHPLNLIERLKLKLHLLVCTWCARYLKQIRMIRDVLHQRNDVDELDHHNLSSDARQRITQSLRDSE